METYEPFVSLALALGAGLLVGIQREQAAPRKEGEPRLLLGGARTYPLFSLAGALSVLVGRALGVWVPVVIFLGLLAPLAIAYADDVRRDRHRGITSEVAFVVVFLLGALVETKGVIEPLSWRLVVVAALAVVVTLLLSAKPALHGLAQKVSGQDVLAALKFLVMAVIVLPLLPNKPFGPLSVLNPFQIGLMVVLISGISFVGYVLVRALGPARGLGITGFVGGLVSSTAVTLSFAGRARREPLLSAGCVLAIVLASTVMFFRMAVLVAFVNSRLLLPLAWPLLLMAVAGTVVSLVVYLRNGRTSKGRTSAGEVRFDNPFELSSAFKFGLVFAVVIFASKAASIYLGTKGAYLAGVLAGTTDVDAITLSMANLAHGGALAAPVATTAVVLAAITNTLVKGVLAVVLGGWSFGRGVLAAFGVISLAGAAGLAVVWLV